jgi:hypothetical protein
LLSSSAFAECGVDGVDGFEDRPESFGRLCEAEPGVRLHIGLEDPIDLIGDLEKGFARFTAALG